MVMNMTFALLLGWVVGYERFFSGRAAGSQVYCLVCTTSCAVALIAGYPTLWYWGTVHDAGGADPTRVIGAVLTGIGFLGAGLIVKSGLNVRGLTTAASIWGSSAIGILVGIGFYGPAIGLTALFVASTALIPVIEQRLPAHSAIAATLRFKRGHEPEPERIHNFLIERGFSIPSDSLSIVYDGECYELQCLVFTNSVARSRVMSQMVRDLTDLPEVERFNIAPSSRA
jgi:putative Mg2+ transporter-C (MgtC) family protein